MTRRALPVALASLGALALTATTTPAFASEVDAIALDSIVVSNSVKPGSALQVGDRVRVDADWTIADGTAPGDTFALRIPAVFGQKDPAPFDLLTSDGAVAGTCRTTGAPPVLTCTTSDYVAGHIGVGGSLYVELDVVDYSAATTATFVGSSGGTVKVDLPGDGGIAPGQSGGEWSPIGSLTKQGFTDWTAGTVRWNIMLPPSIIKPGGPLVITDTLDPDSAPSSFSGSLVPQVGYVCNGAMTPWPEGLTGFEVTPDGQTATLAIAGNDAIDAAHCHYSLTIVATPSEGLTVGDHYSNSVTANSLTTSAGLTIRSRGGGSATGSTPPDDVSTPPSHDATPVTLAATGIPLGGAATASAILLLGGIVLMRAARTARRSAARSAAPRPTP
jgi:hypothetical protein